MRILTVRQPWAWAIIHGGKDVENRTRNIAGDYCGPIAIHAAATTLASFDPSHHDLWPFDRTKHTLGAIIGVVDLRGVHEGHNTERSQFRAVRSCFRSGKPFGPCSPWALPDHQHLELANPRPLTTPIPYKGALGLRALPDDVAREILAEMQNA